MPARELPKYAKTHTFCVEHLGLGYDEANSTGIKSATFHRRLCFALVSDEFERISSNNDDPTAVERFYYTNNNHELTYFSNATKPDMNLSLYPDRASITYYIIRNSAKLSHLTYLVHEICNKHEGKVIAFCD